MAHVVFTPALERHLACPPREVEATTVGEALAAVFATEPRLRSYLLDDQGALREHLTVFVDGRPIADRATLSDPVPGGSEIYVLHALSGG